MLKSIQREKYSKIGMLEKITAERYAKTMVNKT